MLAYIVAIAGVAIYVFLAFFELKKRKQYAFSPAIAIFKLLFYGVFWVYLLSNVYGILTVYAGMPQSDNINYVKAIIKNDTEQNSEITVLRFNNQIRSWQVAELKTPLLAPRMITPFITIEPSKSTEIDILAFPKNGDMIAFADNSKLQEANSLIFAVSANPLVIYTDEINNSKPIEFALSYDNLYLQLAFSIAGFFACLYHLIFGFRGISKFKFVKYSSKLFHFIFLIMFSWLSSSFILTIYKFIF